MTNHDADVTPLPAEEPARAPRRDLLRLAGAATVGGVAASLLSSTEASATTGTMVYGTSMNADASTTVLTSSALSTLQGVNSGSGTGVRGASTGGGTGVLGRIDTPSSQAYALWGLINGTLGYPAVMAGGQAHLYLEPMTNGPSAAATHQRGEVAFDDATNALWVCIADGNPGTWRKIASVNSTGVYHAISPARVYDSRKAAPSPGVLATGANRTISVADKRDVSTGAVTTSNVVPVGATAIAYNLTIVNTVGTNGYLAINEGGNTTVAASIINWTAAAQTIANSSIVPINSSRQVTAICGGTSTSCHFIVDVLGYYL